MLAHENLKHYLPPFEDRFCINDFYVPVMQNNSQLVYCLLLKILDSNLKGALQEILPFAIGKRTFSLVCGMARLYWCYLLHRSLAPTSDFQTVPGNHIGGSYVLEKTGNAK